MQLRSVGTMLRTLRAALEPHFAADTALASASSEQSLSAGHCAVVALIVQKKLGGELVSARVQDQSHWFNRFEVGGRVVDVDLTGDQFGNQPVRLGAAGTLYPGTLVRSRHQLTADTLKRAALLAERSTFAQIADELRAEELNAA
jgi:hypothetical protein